MSQASVIIRVRVTPRGGRDAVIGYREAEGILLLRVAAPPVDGAANKSCVALVAEIFGVKRGQVTLVSGETAREKRFALDGLTETQRDKRLRELSPVADV